MALKLKVEIEGDPNDLSKELRGIANQIIFGYRSGEGWDTEQIQDKGG